MFVVSVVFETAEQDAEAFLIRMRQQAKDSFELEPNCRRFDISVDPKQPGRVLLYELYDTAADFEAHLASAHFKSFAAEVEPIVTRRVIETWEQDTSYREDGV